MNDAVSAVPKPVRPARTQAMTSRAAQPAAIAAKLGALPGVQRLTSTIVMKRVVADRPLPLAPAVGPRHAARPTATQALSPPHSSPANAYAATGNWKEAAIMATRSGGSPRRSPGTG